MCYLEETIYCLLPIDSGLSLGQDEANLADLGTQSSWHQRRTPAKQFL